MSSERAFGRVPSARRAAGNAMAKAAQVNQPGGGDFTDLEDAFEMSEEWKSKWARGLCQSMGHDPGTADFQQCVQSMKARVNSPVSALAQLAAPVDCSACGRVTAYGPARRSAVRVMARLRER